MASARPTVLVIGGSDSSGGAGVGRDLRTLSDREVCGVAVITAVTAQTHTSVQSIHFVPHTMIHDQISTALASNSIHAIKIGMLGNRHAVEAVAASLPLRNAVPIVLDPVLAASAGRALLDDEGRMALIEMLFPRVTLITPNISEAAALLGAPLVRDIEALAGYGTRLLADGPRAVLVKGGHGEGGECVDLLISAASGVTRLSGPRLPGSMRGTGCALATAIAAGLARERPLVGACHEAKRYVASLFEQAIAGR